VAAGEKLLAKGERIAEEAAVTGSERGASRIIGRTGKQARLKELGVDPKVSSADRGWIKSEQNQIKAGNRTNVRVPPGRQLPHEHGREAAKGFSYKYAYLQDKATHTAQHVRDNFGRKNKMRPVR